MHISPLHASSTNSLLNTSSVAHVCDYSLQIMGLIILCQAPHASLQLKTTSLQSTASRAQVTPFELSKNPVAWPPTSVTLFEPAIKAEPIVLAGTLTATQKGVRKSAVGKPWEPPKADNPRNRCAREWKQSCPNGGKSEFDVYYAALSETDKLAYRKHKKRKD
ncbi:hypothetical protein BDZ89DRAFT_228721 [Hymenopellis radicata]|nr:hypothetical protein BDZ89DRAFT_228721 [Hymenopellis radicata]